MAKDLTTKAVEAARADGARREVPDGKVRGLYLVVQPGGGKSWAYRYRLPNGRTRKLTLGPWLALPDDDAPEPALGAALTLAGARRVAGEVAGAVLAGRDPAAEKVSARAVAQAAQPEDDDRDLFPILAEQYIVRHARRNTRDWKTTASRLGLRVDPNSEEPEERRPLVPTEPDPKRPRDPSRVPVKVWAKRRVQDITRRDVVDLLDAAVDDETQGNHVLAVLRGMFSWLEGRGVLEGNPCAGIRQPTRVKPRDRVLSDDELRHLWLACAAPRRGGKGRDDPFGPMVRLLILTGARRDEVAEMEWSELNLNAPQGPIWHVRADRMKNTDAHDAPLAPAAVDLLRCRPRIAKSKYVFTTTGKTPVSGFSRVKARLDAEMLKLMRREAAAAGRDPEAVALPEWRLHDLRHTMATVMGRLGIQPHVIEKVLAHKLGGIARVYQHHDFAAEKRRALEAWAGHVLSLTAARPSNVVPMREAV